MKQVDNQTLSSALNSIWQFRLEILLISYSAKAKEKQFIITPKHHAFVDPRQTKKGLAINKKRLQSLFQKIWKWLSGSLNNTYHWIISAIWASQWATDSFFAAKSWSSSSSCLFCAVNLSTKEQSWNKRFPLYMSYIHLSMCMSTHLQHLNKQHRKLYFIYYFCRTGSWSDPDSRTHFQFIQINSKQRWSRGKQAQGLWRGKRLNCNPSGRQAGIVNALLSVKFSHRNWKVVLSELQESVLQSAVTEMLKLLLGQISDTSMARTSFVSLYIAWTFTGTVQINENIISTLQKSKM